jgi:hypothetical protein
VAYDQPPYENACHGCDSVFVIDLEERSQRPTPLSWGSDHDGRWASGPVGIAPDGSELIYLYAYARLGLVFVSLDDGTHRQVPFPASLGWNYVDFLRWDDSGVWLAFCCGGGHELSLWNASSGQISAVVMHEVFNEQYEEDGYVVSPDGRSIAFWSWHCIRRDYNPERCVSEAHSLRLADFADGQAHVLASALDDIEFLSQCTFQGTAFSPGGSRIAYVIAGNIYMRDVPR